MKDSNLAGEIKLNGRVIPLKSIKLREAFASMSTVSEEIDQLKGATSNEDKTKLVQLQLSLVNMLDEMVKLITKEKKEEAMRSEASG